MSIFSALKEVLHAELHTLSSQTTDEVKQAACSSLRASFDKKYAGRADSQCSAIERANEALTRFAALNVRCGELNSSFDEQISRLSTLHLEILGESRRWLASVLSQLDSDYSDPQRVTLHMVNGPGVCVGSDGLSLYKKAFDSAMPCPSEAAVYLWTNAINGLNQTAAKAEDIRTTKYGPPFVQRAAKWSSVPKTADRDRSIVISSNAGAMLARGIGIDLERILWRLGFDITTQPDRNRDMARYGSLAYGTVHEAWAPATIDLSDASDTLYIRLVTYLLGDLPNLLRALNACRESVVVYPDGSSHKLEIYSTMGCGFTFPLQTLIFLSFAESLLRFGGKPSFLQRNSRLYHQIGVFGDDIVVPNNLFQPLMDFMMAIGLKPNPDKSFGHGSFRESCGTDWYRGVNIRGVYCRSFDSPEDYVSLFNRLTEWSVFHGLELKYTLRFIWNLIPKERRNAVPMWESEIAGIRVPSSMVGLQPTTIRKLTDCPPGNLLYRPYTVSSKAYERPSKGEYVVECTIPSDALTEQSTLQRVKRWHVDNPWGVTLATIHSKLDKGGFAVRTDSKATSLGRWCNTHNWDCSPCDVLSLGVGTTKEWFANIRQTRRDILCWQAYLRDYARCVSIASGHLIMSTSV